MEQLELSFHDTINATPAEKQDFEKKFKGQELKIANYFRDNPGQYTPFDIERAMGFKYPITSIRRAITNLTNFGTLIKTDYQKDGRYNVKNYLWEFNRNQNQIQ